MVRFYNINHFLCSKIFSWAFGFGSTHGGCMPDYHLKDVNLKTWIIHEQLGLGIGWIHFWDPITPRILKITLILQGTYFCYYWPFQALCLPIIICRHNFISCKQERGEKFMAWWECKLQKGQECSHTDVTPDYYCDWWDLGSGYAADGISLGVLFYYTK